MIGTSCLTRSGPMNSVATPCNRSTGAAPVEAAIAVRGKRIEVLEVGEALPEAGQVIDAEGLIVAPGFIDPHLHPCMAALLLQQHCTVTVVHSRTRDIAAICRQADILVAAVGRPRCGTSRNQGRVGLSQKRVRKPVK